MELQAAGLRPMLRIVETEELQGECIAPFRLTEGGCLENAPFGDVLPEETLIDALARHGFDPEPEFEIGNFGSPIGARVYSRRSGQREDYVILPIWPRREGQAVYVEDFPMLLSALARFHALAALPTRACT